MAVYSGVPDAQLFGSHFTEKQEETDGCHEPDLYMVLISTAQIKALQGKNHSISAAVSDRESSLQGGMEQ